MIDSPGEPSARETVRLAAVAWVHPVFAVLLSGPRLLKRCGWRRAFLLASIMGNAVFLTGIVLAELDTTAEESRDPVACSQECTMPDGFACLAQGPMCFGEISPDRDEAQVLAPTVFIVRNGCILASFEYDRERTVIVSAELYDDMCRSKVELDRNTGATIFSHYTDADDPDYSLRDKNGDGIPDVRVDWNEGKSFHRSAEIVWSPLKQP